MRALMPARCVFLLALAACRKSGDTETSRVDTMPSTTTSPARPGVRFDPASLRAGMRVGELVVDSVTAERTPVDSTYVGTAWFRGQIELTGRTLRHPDADLRDIPICFEADSASAARLPRWSGDERRAWFCLANRADAERALGPPSEGVSATIVIERFTIYRGLSDQVNSARFVRMIERGKQ